MNKKRLFKKDELLKKICFYKELSSEGLNVLDGSFYVEKIKKELLEEGLIRKSSLKNTKRTAIKAGVYYKIQSYYVTPKGKRYLFEKFPEEFDKKILNIRKRNNDATERLLKKADSAIMSEITGAYIVNKENIMEEDCVAEENDIQNNDYNNKLKSEIDIILDKYNNLMEMHNKTENELLKEIIKENINRGVFFSADEAKKSLALTKDDIKHYTFTALTGVLLTPAKPYCLYHAGNGFITQTMGGEEKIAKTLIYNYVKNFDLYSDEFINLKISNAIFFCKNISAFAKLVLNKYGTKIAPGDTFDNSYIIPVSRNGCNIIKRFIEVPKYKEKLIDYLIAEYGFKKRTGYYINALPIENSDGEAFFIGIDFDVRKFREAITFITENLDPQCKQIIILCYAWQQDYYEEVINLLNMDKIICQPIDEEIIDSILSFTDRISTVKARKRKKPAYSKNSLHKKYLNLKASNE
jgi:hypothetical protein